MKIEEYDTTISYVLTFWGLPADVLKILSVGVSLKRVT